jgi:predicted PurR-regulated permease PerM
MGKDPTSRTILTLLGLAFVLWLIYLVRDLLPPFLIAFGLATLMDPVVNRIQGRGIPRGLAVAITFVSFLAIFVGALVVFLPLAIAQLGTLGNSIESYYNSVRESVDALMERHVHWLERYHIPHPSAQKLLDDYRQQVITYLQQLLGQILASLRDAAGRLIWVVIVPIVTLYMIIDFERIRARVHHLVPDDHREAVMKISGDVGSVFARYLRGLVTVCVAYGIAMGFALALVFQLPYALVVALAGGILYAVPYIGPVATIGIAGMIAWATSNGHLGHTLGVAITALVINEIFDYGVTPRVLSRQTGLHPILNIFALMVGGSLFGFLGLVFAVPVAASIQEILKHFYPQLTEPIAPERPRRTLPVARFWRRHLKPGPQVAPDGDGTPAASPTLPPQSP